MKSPWQRRMFFTLILIALAFSNASVSPVLAQNQGVAARFPDIAQVTADYPDAAQRSAALSFLYEALNQAAPKPMSKGDYDMDYNYQAATNAIVALHIKQDGAGSPAFKAFTARCNQFVNDPKFAQAVLDKYRLNGMPTYSGPAGPGPSPGAAANAAAGIKGYDDNQTKHDVLTQLPRALPWILAAGILPMAFAAWLVLRGSGIGRKVYPVPASVRAGLPALPKSLQVVSLPGVRYATYVLSGRVLDIQASSHSSSQTTTTGGNSWQDSSGLVHNAPMQSWTTTTNTRETVIWVRTPDNREASWTLYNAIFQCRAGQIISVLVRPLRSGEGEILLAYNHAAGVLEKCPALDQSHAPRGNELGQWAANIAGGYVAAKVLNYFLPMYAGGELDMGFVVSWIAATLMLVTVSFFILTPLVKSFILKRRNASFNVRYLPGFRQFFERGTPVLQSSLRPL